jgi:hypothetical protein
MNFATRQIGDRIPGRIARVHYMRFEERSGRTFVVYMLSDSLRGPRPRRTRVGSVRRRRTLVTGRTEVGEAA